MKTKTLSVLLLMTTFIVVVSFTFSKQQPKPWNVPEKNAKMANPIKSDAASINTGKASWAKNCASCHGKMGKGDGSKAAKLTTHPGDFSAAATQGQSDGALYYKISEGRDDMPAFKKKISDEDEIWSLVNYIRTFKK
ncbi:cytochrome c [Chitinophagaceae bacterium 26-R-25]|nr:cytochrome c [Chitinophagaceae bacterium 26-R-25]